jgi:preprotein translocase subunit SecG
MLHAVLLVIHFICAGFIILLVLLQRGKGAEAGAGFGAGASGTVFGARGASTALSRATAILAGLFMVTSLSLAYVGTRKSAPSSSILEQLSHENQASQVTPATPPASGGLTVTPSDTAPANAPSATSGTPPGAMAPSATPPVTPAPGAAPANGAPSK